MIKACKFFFENSISQKFLIMKVQIEIAGIHFMIINEQKLFYVCGEI